MESGSWFNYLSLRCQTAAKPERQSQAQIAYLEDTNQVWPKNEGASVDESAHFIHWSASQLFIAEFFEQFPRIADKFHQLIENH